MSVIALNSHCDHRDLLFPSKFKPHLVLVCPGMSWYVLAQKWPGIEGHFSARDAGGGIRVYHSAQIAVE